MNRVVSVVLVLVTFMSSPLFAETWQSKVSFEVPATWKVLDTRDTDTVAGKLYLIQKDVIDSETHPSNMFVRYSPVPVNVTIADADSIVASRTKGAIPVIDARDDQDWKTYLLINRERKQKYVVLFRIGIVEGLCLEVMMSFPIVPEKKGESLALVTLNDAYVKSPDRAGIYCPRLTAKPMVDAFNAVCETLKIAKKGEYRADVRIIDPPPDMSVYRYRDEIVDQK